MTRISVIVPTFNRRQLLADAVRSIFRQQTRAPFEVLVVDTASTDGTGEAAGELRCEFPALRYLRTAEPGLHTGRHAGAREAAGGILVFVDDDVIAADGWLEAVREAFEDPGVGLVGGPVLPQWEAEPPWWIELFRDPLPGGWSIGFLSLIDLGRAPRDIPPELVYGCNFSVRRDLLGGCGGFHPDSLPREMIARRGDGESALALAIGRAGYRARYAPGACVRHRVGAGRLTREYFRWRAYCQGISNSYTEVRRRHGLEPPAAVPPTARAGIPGVGRLRRAWRAWRRFGVRRGIEARGIRIEIDSAGREGYAFHQAAVERDPELLRWVLAARYD